MEPEKQVLVVEDDPSIGSLIEIELREAGYAATRVQYGREAIEAVRRYAPDMIILDVRLPDLDGLTVCRQVRRDGYQSPILMLTAMDRVGDRVIGLDAGADDYLAKPFAIEELLARLRALTRRAGGASWLEAGRVRLSPEAREVLLDGQNVELSAREFDLLAFLMHAPGRVSPGSRCPRASGDTTIRVAQEGDRTLPSRRCARSPTHRATRLIRTVRGVGYTVRR